MDELHRALARRISMLRRRLASESSLRRGWRDYAKHMVAERDHARAALARCIAAGDELADEVEARDTSYGPLAREVQAWRAALTARPDTLNPARTPQPTEPQPFPMCKCGHAKIEHIERAGACRCWFTAKSMSWVCACLRYDPAEPPEGQP